MRRRWPLSHAFTVPQPNGQQLTFWVDIDEATRSQVWKSGVNKREQMVREALRHAVDFEHWNRIHPDEEPLQFPLDFIDDVEWRRNARRMKMRRRVSGSSSSEPPPRHGRFRAADQVSMPLICASHPFGLRPSGRRSRRRSEPVYQAASHPVFRRWPARQRGAP